MVFSAIKRQFLACIIQLVSLTVNFLFAKHSNLTLATLTLGQQRLLHVTIWYVFEWPSWIQCDGVQLVVILNGNSSRDRSIA